MATAFESGYGAFLPKHQNEMVQRETLRGQMVKEAAYLTEMDKVYAELDEMARQFDTSLASKESQFSRKLDFEYDSLEQQAEQFDANLALNWYGAKTQRGSAEAGAAYQSGMLDLESDKFDFMQEQSAAEQQLAYDKMDLAADLFGKIDPFSAGAGLTPADGANKPMTTVSPEKSSTTQIPDSPGSGQIMISPTTARLGGDYTRDGNTFTSSGSDYYYPDTFVGAPK